MILSARKSKEALRHAIRGKKMLDQLEPRVMMTAILAVATTDSDSFSAQTDFNNQALTVSQFDTNSGANTLLAVHVSYDTDISLALSATVSNSASNLTPDTETDSATGDTFLNNVPGVTNPALHSTAVLGQATNVVQPGNTLDVSRSATDPESGNLDLLPADVAFSSYAGTGSITALLSANALTSLSSVGPGNGGLSGNWTTTGSGDLQVQYASITPGAISGRKFLDSDPNSTSDNAGDTGLDNWTINLVGQEFDITDPFNNANLYTGQAVSLSTTTSGGGLYSFGNLKPGTYTVSEVQQNGFTQTFGGTYNITIGADGTATVGSLTGNDFGNSPVQQGGASATIGFWQNKNGQGLIKQAGAALATWLSSTFPNLFGTGTQSPFSTLNTGPIHFVNLTGKSGQNVADTFLRFFNVTARKTYAQIMCTALAAYFDSVNNNADAQKFGFGGDLLGNSITITASQASALGVSTTTTVGAILTATNSLMSGQHGVIPPSLFNVFNSVFDQINEAFDIP